MTVDVERVGGICVVSCSGRLTLDDGTRLLRRYCVALFGDGERRMLLDLTGLSHIDSAGVGEVVACSKHALESAAVVTIVVPSQGVVRRVFAVTGLDRAFEIFADRPTALDSMRR